MPIVINEIVIKTNVDSSLSDDDTDQNEANRNFSVSEIVKQSVAKVLEILEEKKQR